ncbi:ATP-binding cassette domain-containing protein [Paenibacillus daejeonensis]|uniref:ATP-binding cassette domain-containing protein n=1 Tax=Paenibacillus daejeonensis TaxID=135193 RepID=UPI00036A1753|nr:ATP-binding cassette domain-containing protein [Paenibacillus daejeonensis]
MMVQKKKSNPVIRMKDVVCRRATGEAPVINGVTLTVERGEWVCVAGGNGSGKSTLVRLLNGLLLAESGTIEIDGRWLRADTLWDIRQKVGIVFPQPDDQFVGLTVEDDLAFGLENQGLSPEAIDKRLWQIAAQFNLTELLDRHPGTLSGGQKQRVALAAVLAMQPEILILDEASAMLDGSSRADLLSWLKRTHRSGLLTIVMITHEIEEMAAADRLIVLREGCVVADGKPGELLGDEGLLQDSRLEIPYALQVCRELRQLGVETGEWTTEREAVDALWALVSKISASPIRMEQALSV